MDPKPQVAYGVPYAVHRLTDFLLFMFPSK